MKKIIFLSVFILFTYSISSAYLEPSFRIKALGADFVGIIKDEYTDIYRNPAYLSSVENYKILGEYRKDASIYLTSIENYKIVGEYSKDVGSRFILGAVLPKFSFGKIAILGKGWQQLSENLSHRDDLYVYSSTSVQQEYSSEYINKTTLNNLGLIYAMSSGQNFHFGANYIYFESKPERENQWKSTNLSSDNRTGLLVVKDERIDEDNSFSIRKFFQIGTGLKFLWRQNLNIDLIFTFQHLNLENIYSRQSSYLTEYYDLSGNISQSYNRQNIQKVVGPDQKGNSFGITLRLSKEMVSLDRMNLLWGFSYINWDTEAENQRASIYDTLRDSIQQFFSGEKKNLDMQLRFGLESKNLNKVKLYAGITNFLGWEKQSYPDFLTTKPTSKWRTSFYKISLPLGVEYTPFNKLCLRYGALPNYIYNRTENFDSSFRWTTSTTKTMSFNNSFGFSYQILKSLTIEGYILQFGELFRVGDWMFGASYSF